MPDHLPKREPYRSPTLPDPRELADVVARYEAFNARIRAHYAAVAELAAAAAIRVRT